MHAIEEKTKVYKTNLDMQIFKEPCLVFLIAFMVISN